MFPIYILLLFVGGLTLTVGDLIAGRYIKKKGKLLYLAVMIFYIIGLNFLIFSYRYEDIAAASVILEIFNVVTLTLAGIFLFKENITKVELLGIIIGLIAVSIL